MELGPEGSKYSEGDISYGLETQYNNYVVETVFFKYSLGKTTK